MVYKMEFDMDRIDGAIKEGKNTIWAEATNMGEIVYEDIKKGFFHNIILAPRIIHNWPNVEFYYSSNASNLESDYLLNIKRWPIVHIRVMNEFIKKEIKGVQYYPIKLVDVITQEVNNNFVLMYIENFIDAFDMKKSKYRYNKEHDFYTFIPKETYIDELVCSKYDIFRCIKSVAGIYVSEKIKQIADENAWIGFSFFEQQ